MAVIISTGVIPKQHRVAMKNAEYTITPMEEKIRAVDIEKIANELEPVTKFQIYPADITTVSTTGTTDSPRQRTWCIWQVSASTYSLSGNTSGTIRVRLQLDPIEWEGMDKPASLNFDIISFDVYSPYAFAGMIELYFEPANGSVASTKAGILYDASDMPKHVVAPFPSVGWYTIVYQIERDGEITTHTYWSETSSGGLGVMPQAAFSVRQSSDWCPVLDEDLIKYTERTQTTADISVKFQEV